MKKQREFICKLNLKIDPNAQNLENESNKSNKSKEEEILKEVENENEEQEGLDTSALQEIMKDDEKFLDLLIKTNDKAVQEIQVGRLKESLLMLERMEKILEYAAINKKLLDRNLVIVCLYNLACNHQALWTLSKCSKYIDGVIYNLNHSIKQDDALLKEALLNKVDLNQRCAIRAIKLRKLQFLLKVYLQHCAVLSQLSRHEDALTFAKKSQKTMSSIISECNDCCKEAEKKIDSPASMHTSQNTQEDSSFLDSRRFFDNGPIFRDEVSYLKNIVEYASPFITDVIETISNFTNQTYKDPLKQTRKSLCNWKNNPENNEKYLRKEFEKSKLPEELKDGNRTLLGVQRPSNEWLENLNIGTIMHMKPIKYKDYAQKKEFTNEITKDALQEKIIFQSIIFFTIATEMRFIEMADDNTGNKPAEVLKANQEEIRNREGYKKSEVYHLNAIEIVCRYVNKQCPYINHLITSYQKHYNQDLETIPEESYCSTSESAATHDISRDYKGNSQMLLQQIDETPLRPKTQETKTNLLKDSKSNLNQMISEKLQMSAESNKKVFSGQSREDRLNLPSQVNQKDLEKTSLKKQAEPPKEKREVKTEGDFRAKKALNMKPKAKLSEDDEAQNVYNANLSSKSLGLDSLLSHNLTAYSSSIGSPSLQKENSNTQKGKSEKKEETTTSPKHFMKRNFEIPNLNSDKMGSSGIKTQIIQDLHSSAEQRPGFMSERNIKKGASGNKKQDLRSNSPQVIDPNDPSINFYFYKNFNKFIQNLYVQDEQGGKKVLSPDGKKESKLSNNPYVKEITAASTTMKKSSQAKRHPPPVQSAKLRQTQTNMQNGYSNNSLSFGRSTTKEDERKSNSIYTQRHPEKDKDVLKINLKDKDFNNKYSNKLVKSLSLKALSNLSLTKSKSDKDRVQHFSPRD